ncbi:hypothetical protein BDN72DRAFT_774127, partial [Pluteus cervinus]
MDLTAAAYTQSPDHIPLTLLDKTISELEDELLKRKTSHNNRIQIVRLHAELLQEIFSHVHSTSQPGERGKASLLLTWICSRWRKVALASSELWTYIDIANPTWAHIALSRTRERPVAFLLPR